MRVAVQALTSAQVPQVAALTDPDQRPVLPVQALEYTSQRQIFLDNAIAVATSACMAKLDVSYAPPVVPSDETGDPAVRRYGVSDLALAQQYGYHLPPQRNLSSKAPSTGSSQLNSLLSGAAHRAPNGAAVPKGGCAAAGATAVVGARPSEAQARANAIALGIVSRIDSESYRATFYTTPVQRIFADWSACMSSKGYSFANPLDALASADLTTATASATEINLATADVSCKISTHLVSRWAAIEAPLQKAAIARAGRELNSYRTQLDRSLSTASQLLGNRAVPR